MGAFVWARRAFNRPKRRFPTRAAPTPASEEFAALLAAANLGRHAARLAAEGYTDAADLVDAEDDELLALGIKRPELRRLRKALPAAA
jgi:hypothetical protein